MVKVKAWSEAQKAWKKTRRHETDKPTRLTDRQGKWQSKVSGSTRGDYEVGREKRDQSGKMQEEMNQNGVEGSVDEDNRRLGRGSSCPRAPMLARSQGRKVPDELFGCPGTQRQVGKLSD